MSFLGCVSQLGAVKVRPLSVPASYTVPASLSSSTQSPPAHRDTLLTPTNQSGDGTMRVMQEIWKNIFLFLEVKNICTLTLFLDPLTNIVDLRTPTPEVTGRTWTTSSPVSTMPDSTIFSSSDKLSEFSTKSLNSSPTTSPTQEKKKLNANNLQALCIQTKVIHSIHQCTCLQWRDWLLHQSGFPVFCSTEEEVSTVDTALGTVPHSRRSQPPVHTLLDSLHWCICCH